MAPAATEQYGLSGTYVKDKERSESQDKLMDKLGVPWLLRKAVGLLATLKFEDSEKELIVTVKASIPGLDSTEVYRYGQETQHQRRDRKPGPLIGTTERKSQHLVTFRSHWAEPNPGHALEQYQLDPAKNEMYVDTEIRFNDGDKIAYRQIYTRKK